ncbi:MAG TPA: GNAT family N-acetyltransferase [Candidatus Limnocylindrales bacterium]|nr:GNAT family N-acetyltransferase [Candidatus Limnocylindrales bacterium]
MIRIRPATADDAAEIADQYALLHADQWSAGGTPPRADHDPDWLAEVTTALASPGTSLFVAEADGVVVGTARIEFAERPYFRIADVRRVYVRPAWRRRGVGVELMRAAEAAAMEGGAAEVRLSVVPENEPALAFYRHLGYGDFAIRLSKRIRP